MNQQVLIQDLLNSEFMNRTGHIFGRLENHFKADIISICGFLESNFVKKIVDLCKESKAKSNNQNVVFILYSGGGDERGFEVFIREVLPLYKDGKVNIIVPKKALSTATLISLYADELFVTDDTLFSMVDPQLRDGISYFICLLKKEGNNNYAITFDDSNPDFENSMTVSYMEEKGWTSKFDQMQAFNEINRFRRHAYDGLLNHNLRGKTNANQRAIKAANYLINVTGYYPRKHDMDLYVSELKEAGIEITNLTKIQDYEGSIGYSVKTDIAYYHRQIGFVNNLDSTQNAISFHGNVLTCFAQSKDGFVF